MSVRVGALWIREKDGRRFLTGTLELGGREGTKVNIAVFPNDRKEKGTKQPDYNITSDSALPAPGGGVPAGDDEVPF